MDLSRFPRVSLAHLPTPLEPLERLSDHLGGPRLYVKRDDCTGLALGGNKTRKLEFLMAEALAEGADTVITAGGVQSNHVRQTAAAAAKLGLKCELVQQVARPWDQDQFGETGNLFLDRLLGAGLHSVPGEADRGPGMARLADELRTQGRKPYVIPGGGSNAVGGLGYAGCAQEIIEQAEAMDMTVDVVVMATGSGGTQGGFIAGLVAMNSAIRAIGIEIDADPEAVDGHVRGVANGTLDLLGVAGGLPDGVVEINPDYAGAAYGKPTDAMVKSVTLVARLEGLILDPVYSGKAMAGLIDLVKRGEFKPTDTVVFVHTGGAPALFAYRSAFSDI
jgi:L-cysteate sulfo-lyase